MALNTYTMYALPDTLPQDIAELGDQARKFADGELDPASFKIRRVPMGIYEQRTDGTFMVRVRTTGGVITPSQLAAVAEIAVAHGSDLLHITTRQEVQIQNVRIDVVESILERLRQIGLSSKGGGGNTVRNILVPPESGINGHEAFDPTPHAMALTTRLIAEPDSFTLPRKLKIAFSGSEERTDYAGVNDIGLVARIRDGRRGFKVYLGGSVASKPHIGWVLADFLPEEQLFILAEAVKKFFSEQGNRKNKHKARLRFIFYKLGQEEAFRLFSEYFQEAKKNTPLFTPAQEVRTLAPAEPFRPEDGGEEFVRWFRRYVSGQVQEGYYSVTLPFLHGNIPLSDPILVEKFAGLVRWLQRFGEDTIRFTPAQNILLRNIPGSVLPELRNRIGELTDLLSLPLLVNNIVSCTGADTCRLGICLSKGLAAAIRHRLAHSNLDLDALDGFRLQISGCPNSCGQQVWADLGFNGKVLRNDRIYPGYQVFTGAGRGPRPALAESIGSLPAHYVPEAVEKILGRYLEKIGDYPDFRAYSEAEGNDYLRQLLVQYKEVPPFTEDKNPYFDWGADQPFTVAGRGVAECSAGLFDMIDIDLKNIETHREKLKDAAPEAVPDLLYRIVYSSARMLLVTRGAEPKTTADVFELFEKLFIQAGIVPTRYLPLIREAATHGAIHLAGRDEEVLSLAQTVILLYETMDDSLQFKIRPSLPGDPRPEPSDSAGAEKEVEVKRKDLRGVACPMNFVQTKIELAKMASGSLLEIRLDDGQPIANVPGSVRGEGHTVLEEVREGDHWKVLIRKK